MGVVAFADLVGAELVEFVRVVVAAAVVAVVVVVVVVLVVVVVVVRYSFMFWGPRTSRESRKWCLGTCIRMTGLG